MDEYLYKSETTRIEKGRCKERENYREREKVGERERET
jgi:hypothetical protein